MPTIRTIAARINREGQEIVLTRASQSVPLKGFVRGYKSNELVNGITQGDREVTISDVEISTTGWPGPPRKGDAALIASKVAFVQSCETRTFRGKVAKHVIQVRGG